MFLAKGQKTLQAILLSFRNGFEQDAEMLTRSLIEAGSNLMWVAEDPDDRFEKWAEYEGKRRMALIQHGRDAIPNVVTLLDEQKIEDARVVRDAYYNRAERDRFPTDLPNRLRQTKMAPATRASLYLAYSMATDLVHTNPNCRTHYVKHDSDGVHFDSGPAVPPDPRILGPAVFSYLMLAEAFAKIVGIDVGSALAESSVYLEEVFGAKPAASQE